MFFQRSNLNSLFASMRKVGERDRAIEMGTIEEYIQKYGLNDAEANLLRSQQKRSKQKKAPQIDWDNVK